MKMAEFLGLAIALFFLGFGSILALRFKIPPIIVFLLMGVIIGSSNLLGQTTILSFIGDLGSILLLFAIGTEFSIYSLLKTDFKKATVIALIQLVSTFIVLFLIFSHWFTMEVALLLGLAFSISSTAITLKLIQELGLSLKFNIPLIINISVVEDMIAVFMYTTISSFAVNHTQALNTIIIDFIFSILLFVVAYIAFYEIFTRIIYRYTIREEDLLILALGVLLLFVTIATGLNLSSAFGAYIAGSIVSIWKGRWRSLEKDLQVFSYVFIAFFFFTIGLKVNIGLVNFWLLLLIFPLTFLVKLFAAFFGNLSVLRSFRVSLFNTLSVIPRGELSLVIISAAVSSQLLPESFLGLTSFIVFFSAIVAFFLMGRSERIYTFLK
ncbi:MAG: cation:proton antiporter [Candidatus Micrarchaeota archaeon]|nr:cation:proton antiporter [Candidatus Micrarchaeota archaeon]